MFKKICYGIGIFGFIGFVISLITLGVTSFNETEFNKFHIVIPLLVILFGVVLNTCYKIFINLKEMFKFTKNKFFNGIFNVAIFGLAFSPIILNTTLIFYLVKKVLGESLMFEVVVAYPSVHFPVLCFLILLGNSALWFLGQCIKYR